MITSPEEYSKKEERFNQISQELEDILLNNNSIDMSKIVSLRDEARGLAKELKEYLLEIFPNGVKDVS